MKITRELQIELSTNQMVQLLGTNNEYINYLEKKLNVEIFSRGQSIEITGSTRSVEKFIDVINKMIEYINNNQSLSLGQIKQFSNGNALMDTTKAKPITYTIQGKQIYPKTLGQANLIEAMKEHDMVFNLGPAGTGKTFLSVAYGVHLLRDNKIKRIILVRPAVEAGENLGFLPGDLKEKVDPYLQPLYDALNLLLGQESVEKYLEKGIIEIAPLAYMRGRTLDDAMVILDEAQNTTKAQMKMFLTRMGFNSRMIINGDITQIDLKTPSDSGLLEAIKILKGIPEISIFELGLEDIVRHALVNKILQRYQGE